MVLHEQVFVVRDSLMDDVAESDLTDYKVFLRVFAAGVVERLFRVAVGFFKLRQQFLREGGAVVFAQQAHGGDGRLDLVDPLFDIFPVGRPLTFDAGDLFQHGLFGKPKDLPVDLVFRARRLLHHIGDQTAPLKLFRYVQQPVQFFPTQVTADRSTEKQDQQPDEHDEQDSVRAAAGGKEEEGERQHTQHVQEEKGNPVFPVQSCVHMVYPCRCLVLMKSSRPMADSFSRIRLILTLRALSST